MCNYRLGECWVQTGHTGFIRVRSESRATLRLFIFCVDLRPVMRGKDRQPVHCLRVDTYRPYLGALLAVEEDVADAV